MVSADDRSVAELLAALCDETISPEEMQRLDRLICTEAAVRRAYLEYLDLHARLSYRFHQPAEAMSLEATGEQEAAESGEWKVESEVSASADNQQSAVNPQQSTIPPIILDLSPTLHSSVGGFLFSYTMAALILGLAMLAGWTWKISRDWSVVQDARRQIPESVTPEAQFVGRITGTVDCRWTKWSVVSGQWSVVSESEIRNPKSQILNQELLVTLGAKYNLTSGFMEITYDSGAKVILQGPCTYEVESAVGGFLSLGKLTARVEKRAEGGGRRAEKEALGLQGDVNRQSTINNQQSSSALRLPPSALFSVRTPTAVVTDLGTEFGVEVDRSGASRAQVFRGRVELRPTQSGGDPQQVVQLGANESARVEGGRNRAFKVIREPLRLNAFARWMPKPGPLKLFNTGVGLKEGDLDPHWQVVARSDDPNFKPQPAVVTAVGPGHLANDPGEAQWISLSNGPPQLPNGVTCTFRTTFEIKEGMLPGQRPTWRAGSTHSAT